MLGIKMLDNFRTFTSAVNAEKKDLVEDLKMTLANATVLYHTIHGFHWNVKGSDFYEYHKFFDEIVSDIYGSLDPIAENILKLGGVAPFHLPELMELSTIVAPKPTSMEPKSLASAFAKINLQMVDKLKATFEIANKDKEQGVANFIAERIDAHQKWDWFLTSSLGK